MPNIPAIRILEADSNRRGDLFGRLMGDLFLALGFGEVRLNIHKSGREIDIEAIHRIESRRVVAECKATKTKTGGDDVNKFVGSLDAEKRKYSEGETTGYYISLSGFKETAIEQEREAGNNRVNMLNGSRVLVELIKGSILVPQELAMERAGRCAGDQPAALKPEPACDLLAHEMGWIWAVYFTTNKKRTHFSLIHADGESISAELAELIIESDESVKGNLRSLTFLPPKEEPIGSGSQVIEAREKYFQYLANECGEIQLEGLPTDQEVGSRRLNLENIFVPLHLDELKTSREKSTQSVEEAPEDSQPERRRPVGEVLSEHSRLAILAAPGGGKSTLIKRSAVAYAFPERRALVHDGLPDKPWLPLFIRCRQLGEMVTSPITDIIQAIPQRAEMSDLAGAFKSIVRSALRNGEVLLLVDGLDEISDEGARVSFVHQLRTFLATYPTVSVVVTSREAGFRIVGGALAAHCQHYRISDFDNDDITRLTLAWHKEVVGESLEIQRDAEKLAQDICGHDRVKQLAQNPLLLTTLLLVNRWVGQLPTRRSVLYGKAIEVLLMTWNVEGHEPLDQEEVIPQLAFIAFTMMEEGIQRISSRRLTQLLHLAREQMPEILGYARLSVAEFVSRVEDRSSMLMLSGL